MVFGWINVFQLIIIAIMMAPNIQYALRHKNTAHVCTNRVMHILEQVGRYACILFMVFSFDSRGFGFPSIELFLIYFLGIPLLLIIYLGLWEIQLGDNRLAPVYVIVGLALLPCGMVFGTTVPWTITFILLLAAVGPILLQNVLPEPSKGTEMALSIVPVLIFLLCGITLVNLPLIASAILFGIAHPYITWKTMK